MQDRHYARRWLGVFVLAVGWLVAGVSLRVDFSIAEMPADEPGHPRLDAPADLTREAAIDAYESIVDRMEMLYALSGDATATHYRRWHRYNDAPYRSETHGNRYVNNYANLIARRAGYGRMAAGERMPPGGIVAKDSLTVTGVGGRFPGALFIMEKLAAGTSPETADWRYAMIMPDGSFYGDTMGETKATVAFCHECHQQRAADDYLFFLPRDMRFPAE